MLTRSRMMRDLFPRVARRALALAALLTVFASAALLTPEAHAQEKKKNGKPPTTGTIEISTTPGGSPIYIDGVYSGVTTEYMRSFPDQKPGPHKVMIVFPDGTEWKHDVYTTAGRKDCISLTYQPRKPPPGPIETFCPYPVNMTAQAVAMNGEQITFEAKVLYTGPSKLNYTWTVSPQTAEITGGAGTQAITVDTTDVGRRVTATLVVDDGSGDPACRRQVEASTLIPTPPPPPTPVSPGFVSVAPDDDKARLDYLAIEMSSNPSYRAFLIAYGGCGRRDRSPEVLLKRAYSYLVTDRKMDRNRITGILGGYRERNGFELYVQSPGEIDPVPRPTRGPCTGGRSTRR